MVTEVWWLIIILTLCGVAWAYFSRRAYWVEPDRTTLSTTVQRLLKPCTPDDCPPCRRERVPSRSILAPPSPVRPWCERKSRRGKPKHIATASTGHCWLMRAGWSRDRSTSHAMR
jgi:hypothetical protein